MILRDPIQYNTMQYNTVQYSTVQYITIQVYAMQYNTIQYKLYKCIVRCLRLCLEAIGLFKEDTLSTQVVIYSKSIILEETTAEMLIAYIVP